MEISDVRICNMALSGLGLAAISSLTEASAEAVQCNLHFEPARDAVLRDYPWNFATKRFALTESGEVTPPAGVWGFAYTLPPDCLTAREIVVAAGDAPPFAIEAISSGLGRILYTNEEDAVLLYTARITEPTLFDPKFVEALRWNLASQICMPLTRNTTLMQMAVTLYQNALASAQRVDANEGVPETPRDASWIEARGIDGSAMTVRVQ